MEIENNEDSWTVRNGYASHMMDVWTESRWFGIYTVVTSQERVVTEMPSVPLPEEV